MPWSTAGRNVRADALGTLITAVSLHTGDPGDTGANEWAGGSYARQAPSFEEADGGVITLTAGLTFSGPPLTDAAHIGLWSGATFLGGMPRSGGDAASNAAGEYVLGSLSFTIPATITA